MAPKKKYDAELFAAIHTLATACRGRLRAGEDVAGTVRVEGLDIEVSLRIRPVVSSADTHQHQKAALELLAREGYRDRCPCQVKNRGPWSVTKTKSCDSRVTTAIARRGTEVKDGRVVDVVRYDFRCHRHDDGAGTDVIAIVRLSPAELAAQRAARARRNEERIAEERRIEDEARAKAAK